MTVRQQRIPYKSVHCTTVLCMLYLWDRQLHNTSAAHQVRRAGFLLLQPSVMELSRCWTKHHLWYKRF